MADLIDLHSLPEDLPQPIVEDGLPSAGKRTWVSLHGYGIRFSLFLPVDWQAGKSFPVIIEYPGNGPYNNEFGDACTGRIEDCVLGYGISKGSGFLWACLPFVSVDRTSHSSEWWGDVQTTVDYCIQAVDGICNSFGGNNNRIFLVGFSRGSIACNYIGLQNDEIASLWHGFICHSHYDGVYPWPYPGSDEDSAIRRLRRLNDRPQWISHEATNIFPDCTIISRPLEDARRWLSKIYSSENFTFKTMSFRNHSDRWVLRDLSERDALRAWVQALI